MPMCRLRHMLRVSLYVLRPGFDRSPQSSGSRSGTLFTTMNLECRWECYTASSHRAVTCTNCSVSLRSVHLRSVSSTEAKGYVMIRGEISVRFRCGEEDTLLDWSRFTARI